MYGKETGYVRVCFKQPNNPLPSLLSELLFILSFRQGLCQSGDRKIRGEKIKALNFSQEVDNVVAEMYTNQVLHTNVKLQLSN